MPLKIRKADEADIGPILELLREFADFEDLADAVEITEEKLRAAIFGDKGFVECLVADDGSRLAAYALLYPNFASFRGQKGLFLEDLYIRPDHRRTGLGLRMLGEIAKLARDKGCQRIDFQVLDWNSPAIAFYLKNGAIKDESERHFKFTDEAFSRLIDL